MTIELPEIPAGILTLLALASPYAIAAVNGLTRATGWAKRVVSVAVSLVLAGVALAVYYWVTGDTLPNVPGLLLLAVLVSESSYGLILKGSAKSVENKVAVSTVTRIATRDPHQEEHSIIPAENEGGPSLTEVGGWEDPDLTDTEAELTEYAADIEAIQNEPADDDDTSRGRYAK